MELSSLYSNAFYLVLILKTTTQLVLGLRNRRHLRRNYERVPLELADDFTLEQHQKAIRYHFDKSQVSKWSLQASTIFLLALFPLGWANKLDLFLRSYELNEIVTGLVFLGVISVFNFILSLPFTLYQTFFIEEKYGFNKTTAKTFILDVLKQTILALVLMTPLLAGILYSFIHLGYLWWIIAWAVVVIFQIIALWLYPRFIAPLFNDFSPLNNPLLTDQIHKLTQRTGFEAQSIEVMDASRRSSHGNAYFTGLGKQKKIVFFDTLIEKLTHNEILAVLAHEIGHFSLKHILKRLGISLVLSFIFFAILGFLSHDPQFFHGHFIHNPSSYTALFIFSYILPLYLFFLTPLSSLSSRRHEFQADHFAIQFSQAQDLKKALIKLSRDNSSLLTIDPLYAFFYYSHPPLIQRLESLQTAHLARQDKSSSIS